MRGLPAPDSPNWHKAPEAISDAGRLLQRSKSWWKSPAVCAKDNASSGNRAGKPLEAQSATPPNPRMSVADAAAAPSEKRVLNTAFALGGNSTNFQLTQATA